jgi:DNA-binding transcriptional ArsR family regulator
MNEAKRLIDTEDLCDVRTIHLNRVIQARKERISGREIERLALTYRILGDPTRLKIVMALKSGEMCVCDIAAFIGLSESAVSHQLRRLRELAIVKHRREGQVLYYSLDDDHINDMIQIGMAHIRE